MGCGKITRPDSRAAAARSPGADRHQELRARATEYSDRRILPLRTALSLSSVSIASANTQSALGKIPLANPDRPRVCRSTRIGWHREDARWAGKPWRRPDAVSTPKRRKSGASCATTALHAGGTLRLFIWTDCEGRGQGVGQSDRLAEWYPGSCSSVFLLLNTHPAIVKG